MNPGSYATMVQIGKSMALLEAFKSPDPFCKVGAYVSGDGGVFYVGHNGPAPGYSIDLSDRERRRPLVVHAEAMALRNATPEQTDGGFMVVTHFPCAPCTLLAISYGIKEVFWGEPPNWETYPAQETYRVANAYGLAVTSYVDWMRTI